MCTTVTKQSIMYMGIPWWSWIRLCAFIAEGMDSIPGWGTNIPQAACSEAKKYIYIMYIIVLIAHTLLLCHIQAIKNSAL